MSNRIRTRFDSRTRQQEEQRAARNQRRNTRKADTKATFGGLRFVPFIAFSRATVGEKRPRRAPEGYAFDGRGDRVSLRRHARRVRVTP